MNGGRAFEAGVTSLSIPVVAVRGYKQRNYINITQTSVAAVITPRTINPVAAQAVQVLPITLSVLLIAFTSL